MLKIIKSIFYIISICFYVLAGLFIFLFNCWSSISINKDILKDPLVTNDALLTVKLAMLTTYAVIGLVLLFFAMATNGFKNCQRSVGVTMVCAGLFSVLTLVSAICMWQSPEFMQNFPPEAPQSFKFDYLTSGLTTAATLLIGTLLVKYAKNDTIYEEEEADDGATP